MDALLAKRARRPFAQLNGRQMAISETDTRPRNQVRVLYKVAQILDLLAEEGELSAARLAELIDEPRTTVYRLLSSLRDLGYVEQGMARGSYRLGLHLFRLGTVVVERFDVRQAALPVMERVNAETEETVFLTIRRGDEAVCIERLEGRRVQSMALQLGGSLPLHLGAGPRTLLAFSPREEWDEYFSRASFERLTDKTPVTPEQAVALLERVLENHCSVGDGDITPGIAAVGAPIYGFDGDVIAAISMSGTEATILGKNRKQNCRIIVDAGREASRALGYAGG